ncbi:hypothetical protein RF55_11333 [Lasius niger]|uniref:N-acetyltransferase domain-containing protein n=1 Tax=Lasius niger TaxID=67767 RepID=A0A0J7KFU8_LASNI|nr:hypothetical protein RF55_11333 [Lasius niger]
MEQEALLHPKKNSLFRHCKHQYFIAWVDDKPVGRIAALIDGVAQEYLQKKIGYFGALDCIPDPKIVAALLKAAEEWLLTQGIKTAMGPLTLSSNGESGVMVSGQQTDIMVETPWHPEGLADLIEASGYTRTEDLLSYRLEIKSEQVQNYKSPGNLEIGAGRLKDVTIEKVSKKQIQQQAEILRGLYNDAWDSAYNFVPLQDYEMKDMLHRMKPIIHPNNYVQINRSGEPLAIALVIPNVYELSEGIGATPSLWGWMKIGWRLLRGRFKSGRVILLGVSKKIRGTVLGSLFPGLAIHELIKRAGLPGMNFDWVELGWIRNKDRPMRNLIEDSLAPEPYKVHRLFEKEIS